MDADETGDGVGLLGDRAVTDKRIPLTEEVQSICEKLGVKYEDCRRIEIYPAHVMVEYYVLDDHGAKHIEMDEESQTFGLVVTEFKNYAIKT